MVEERPVIGRIVVVSATSAIEIGVISVYRLIVVQSARPQIHKASENGYKDQPYKEEHFPVGLGQVNYPIQEGRSASSRAYGLRRSGAAPYVCACAKFSVIHGLLQ